MLQLIVVKDRNHMVGVPPSTIKHNDGSTASAMLH